MTKTYMIEVIKTDTTTRYVIRNMRTQAIHSVWYNFHTAHMAVRDLNGMLPHQLAVVA